uniref:Secreted protein n=1 Tax=Rhipicephalus microplus TaxID=6941 RepID=A0A6M2CS19_RHIMP
MGNATHEASHSTRMGSIAWILVSFVLLVPCGQQPLNRKTNLGRSLAARLHHLCSSRLTNPNQLLRFTTRYYFNRNKGASRNARVKTHAVRIIFMMADRLQRHIFF